MADNAVTSSTQARDIIQDVTSFRHYIVVAVLLLIAPLISHAATIAELQAQLQSLLAQIQQLQTLIEQLTAQPGGSATNAGDFCHTFNRDLQFGDTSSEGDVELWHLRSALEKAGLAVGAGDDKDGRSFVKFGESTRAAVIKLQAKYGIRQTGYVGPLTRAQLNRLWGCRKDASQTASAMFPTVVAVSESVKDQYAYITKFHTAHGLHFADVDYIELDSSQMGAQNGYPAVINNNPRMRTFIVSDVVRIEDKFTKFGMGIPVDVISLTELEARLLKKEESGKKLYIRFTAEKGVIHAIEVPWRP